MFCFFFRRYSDPNNIIKKRPIKPIPAYENWIECQNVRELEAIRRNFDALHMESLTIRERILGKRNPEVAHPIIFRGAVFADHLYFERCIQLWLHALDLRRANGISVVQDLLRFAQVFSQMLHLGDKLKLEYVVKVLSAAIDELENGKLRLTRPGPKDDPDTIMVSKKNNIIYFFGRFNL